MDSGARVRVWDLPTRLFHWLIVLLVPFQYWSAETDRTEWHMLAGTLVLGLVLFRILWGVFGSRTARFSSFVRGPRAILSYLRGGAPSTLGHNPLGGWSAIAMLVLLTLQVGLGLFALDEEAIHGGPLSDLVSYDSGVAIAELHELAFKILLGFIALHLAAIAWHALIRRDDLVTPMLTGRRAADPDMAGIEPVSPARFAAVAAAAAALTWLLVRGH